jgi:uncharacterized protein YqgV (UPF0045/DUF77 family)
MQHIIDTFKNNIDLIISRIKERAIREQISPYNTMEEASFLAVFGASSARS